MFAMANPFSVFSVIVDGKHVFMRFKSENIQIVVNEARQVLLRTIAIIFKREVQALYKRN